MNKEEIVDKHLDLIKRYKELNKDLYFVLKQINEYNEHMKFEELKAKKIVLYAVNEDGKKKYSNEAQREIAENEILQDNETYQNQKKARSDLMNRQYLIKMELEIVSFEKSAYKSMVTVLTHKEE